MYIFRGRDVFNDVYNADDKIATAGSASLADIDLRRTYRAIDSVATGQNTIPSLFCDGRQQKHPINMQVVNKVTNQSYRYHTKSKLRINSNQKHPITIQGVNKATNQL